MRPGDVVDERFEIERHAGQGGMGVVYRARDRLDGGSVALKVLRDASNVEADRFAREAEVLAELRHSGIVRYVGHGRTAEEQPYLAMEWLDGRGLDEVIRDQKLPTGDALSLLRRVAEALDIAHRRGVVHRDLKPSNLFLAGGELSGVKILDFGIARLLARGARPLTATGSMIGTPGYMAPEQARGLSTVDARADVFSLGVLLYRCLVGKTPFQGEDVLAVLVKLVLEEAPRLRDDAPELPPALDDLVARMLAKAPADRPADAAALLAELDALHADTIPTQPLSVRDGPASVGSPPSVSSSLTSEEQRVLCVVLARATEDALAPPTLELELELELEPELTEGALHEIVERYGGKLELLVDGPLVVTVTGSGSASDHAIGAARCALALRSALSGVALAVTAGHAVTSRRLPVGKVIDRGVALLAASEAGAIRIDDEMARLLDVRFEISAGPSGPCLASERASDEPARTLLGKPTTCVGRERDLALIEATLEQCASEPEAAIVLVTAPPGTGKSRLRHELLRRLAASADGQSWQIWIASGDPTSAGAPFDMIAQMVRRAAGVLEGEPTAERQRKLRERVRRHVPAEDAARITEFLGELVGAPFPAAESVQLRAARQDPMLMGDQIRFAFLDLLAAECGAAPLMLVLEDLHWGDLPTVTLIDSAVRLNEERPLLVLALARPDVVQIFPNLWSKRGIQELKLHPLAPRSSERMVREALGDRIDAATVTRIVERAGGNPFYLEELIRAVAEGKGDALPMTVLAMVESRLEALDPEQRRLLRAASVFGQVFWAGGVRALTSTGADLDARLAKLVDSEVIAPRAEGKLAGEQEYVFRHLLLRDAAYAMLIDADRALGHRLAGNWLEGAGLSEPMVLADHFERGGEPARAVRHYSRAAEQAFQGNDLDASLARVHKGLDCLARALAEGRDAETMDLLPGAPPPERVTRRDAGPLLILESEMHRWRGEFAAAERCAHEAMELLPTGSEGWFLAGAEAVLASSRVGLTGPMVEVAELLCASDVDGEGARGKVLALGRTVSSLVSQGRYDLVDRTLAQIDAAPLVTDPAVLARVADARARSVIVRGDLSGFLHLKEASLANAERAGDARYACTARVSVGFAWLELGAYANAERALVLALEDAERLGLPAVIPAAQQNLGVALAMLGRADEARAMEQESIDAFRAQTHRRMESIAHVYLSRMLAQAGDLAGAEREAHLAVEVSPAPPVRAQALAALSLVLLASGRHQAALSVASEAKGILDQLGAVEEGESLVRLAYAEAAHATGDAGASAAIRAARDHLLARAGRIADPDLRSSFLHNIPENARTLELAAAASE